MFLSSLISARENMIRSAQQQWGWRRVKPEVLSYPGGQIGGSSQPVGLFIVLSHSPMHFLSHFKSFIFFKHGEYMKRPIPLIWWYSVRTWEAQQDLTKYSLGLCATTYIWSLNHNNRSSQYQNMRPFIFYPSHDLGYITFARTGFQKF